ncbi:hypothetical protein AGMMS49959_11500 [Planctomycetales bacterium]|nr:hypothetical protein AGMMS49959_11500 [Planctomycetales bacterium]
MSKQMTMLLGLLAIDRHLLGLKRILDALPLDEEKQKMRVDATRAGFAEVDQTLKDLAADNRRRQGEVAGLNAEIAELDGKLKIVKNQKEYAIVTERVNDLRRQIAAEEEKQLTNLEEIDGLQKVFAGKKRDLDDADADLATHRQNAAVKIVAVKAEQKKLVADRKRQIAAIDAVFPDAMKIYQTALQSGKGLAMAKLVNGVCAECRRQATVNLIAIVAGGNDFPLCAGCGRILYAPAE